MSLLLGHGAPAVGSNTLQGQLFTSAAACRGVTFGFRFGNIAEESSRSADEVQLTLNKGEGVVKFEVRSKPKWQKRIRAAGDSTGQPAGVWRSSVTRRVERAFGLPMRYRGASTVRRQKSGMRLPCGYRVNQPIMRRRQQRRIRYCLRQRAGREKAVSGFTGAAPSASVATITGTGRKARLAVAV